MRCKEGFLERSQCCAPLDGVFTEVKKEESGRNVMLGEKKVSNYILVVRSWELEEEYVVIIVKNSATPKTNTRCCMENLPIGGLDRVMKGNFKL